MPLNSQSICDLNTSFKHVVKSNGYCIFIKRAVDSLAKETQVWGTPNFNIIKRDVNFWRSVRNEVYLARSFWTELCENSWNDLAQSRSVQFDQLSWTITYCEIEQISLIQSPKQSLKWVLTEEELQWLSRFNVFRYRKHSIRLIH